MTIPSRIPRATYRLQLNREFTFAQATAIVPYLASLGISHCYVSPCLKARPGSMHGYDIVDHNSLNPEIGSPEDFDRFVSALHEHDMGLILDIVPNHMGIMGSDNAWWLDVLENGESSPYAGFFDIDWTPLKDELRGKVLVPVLHDHYGVVLEGGELNLVFNPERGEFDVFYHEHRFPVDPREYPRILQHCTAKPSPEIGEGNADLLEFQSLITSFGNLPAR
jgi:(1->4)-alpha-D-glucan 1-alpha-D-glucosylmutase